MQTLLYSLVNTTGTQTAGQCHIVFDSKRGINYMKLDEEKKINVVLYNNNNSEN